MNRARALQLTAALVAAGLVVLGVVRWRAGRSPESVERVGGEPSVPAAGLQSMRVF